MNQVEDSIYLWEKFNQGETKGWRQGWKKKRRRTQESIEWRWEESVGNIRGVTERGWVN